MQTENRITGPSQNAVKFGLTAKADRAIAGEDPQELAEFFQSIRDSLQPVGAAEQAEVEQIAQNYWRLRRCGVFEKSILDLSYALNSQDPPPSANMPSSWPTEAEVQKRSALPRDVYAEKLHRHELHAAKLLGAAINRLAQLRALRTGNPPPVFIVQSPIPRRQRRPRLQNKSANHRITGLAN